MIANQSTNNLGVIEVRQGSVKEQVLAVWRQLGVWFARMEERRQLAQLDERMLKDFGATRDEVAAEVRKPFWVA